MTGTRTSWTRTGGRLDVDRLIRRTAAIQRFTDAAGGHLPAEALRPALAIVGRVQGRLDVSRDHTVVALAGATGSGKSSLFNALAGGPVSPVGVRRPTTGEAHACVWGPDAGGLLDWLDIPAGRRFTPPAGTPTGSPTGSRPGDDIGLTGLVLLDLPDFDSVRTGHRDEADRLLRSADLVVWVTDPQKYADRILHQHYLRAVSQHAATTIVVLNQSDRLSATDTRRCLADLTTLLTADGFPAVPVLAVSATADPPGTAALTRALRGAVSQRMAMLRRLSVDIDDAVAASRPLIGSTPPDQAITRRAAAALSDALAVSAGVPIILDATARAYRFRARASIGWPVTRWIRRIRTDPLIRLRLGRANVAQIEASSLPRPSAPGDAGTDLAVRALIDETTGGLPAPWSDAVTRAARSGQPTLPDALDQAVVGTDLGIDRKPYWWRAIDLWQWALTVLAVAGGLWLLTRIVLIALGLDNLVNPQVDLATGRHLPFATLALIGGAAAGLLTTVVTRPLVTIGARRARRRAAKRLTVAVAEVGRTLIEAPVRQVLDDYAEAGRALADAAG